MAGTAGGKRGGASASGGRNNALNMKVGYSEDLAAVVGKGPMARSEITAKLWDYIKAHKLQAEDDKRQIEPDETLAKVIGKKRISMFQMTAEVSKHIDKG
ncbi:MAG: SWIB/MDM2 domain-containing protein [Chakrabartia sp.]